MDVIKASFIGMDDRNLPLAFDTHVTGLAAALTGADQSIRVQN
jgi:hypothetical protein